MNSQRTQASTKENSDRKIHENGSILDAAIWLRLRRKTGGAEPLNQDKWLELVPSR